MMLPEAEALNIKWCPFARVSYYDKTGATAGNRYVQGAETEVNPPASRCIGSACMAWLWMDPETVTLSQQPAGDPVRRGCCGMANATRTSVL